jgi:hypothetical protein
MQGLLPGARKKVVQSIDAIHRRKLKKYYSMKNQ